MKGKLIVSIAALVALGLGLFGCDMIPGLGEQAQPAPVPAVAPPAQPAALPGAVPAAPATAPAAPATAPAAPATAPTAAPVAAAPATPVAPAAPAAVPTPGQPAAAAAPTVATAPTAALAPGQPAPTAAAPAAAPAAPATAPTATAEPASTGDPLTDQMNAVKAQQAADRAPTSALVKLTLAKGEKQSYQVQLPGPPFCHTYAAVGADTVKNLDIAIASPTGTAEAQDDTEEATAVIANHCPTVAGPYTLTVTSTKGKGEIAVQVFSK